MLRPLLDFLAPRGERVLEIGPGDGILTRALLGEGARRVLAVELDPAWGLRLGARVPGGDLAVAIADGLELDWSRLPAPTLVAGNLPYNVGTAILERMLVAAPPVPRAAFLLQREVVERIVARPGEPDYGAFSVIVAAAAEARRLGVVRPGAFVPPPRVESAFVGLRLRARAVGPAELPRFARAVRVAFASRRKTLRNALAFAWGRADAEAILADAGIDAGRRAEQLDLDAHVALFRSAVAHGMLGSNS